MANPNSLPAWLPTLAGSLSAEMAYRRIFDPTQDKWRVYDCDALKWKPLCSPAAHPMIGPYSRYKHILKAWKRYWQ